MFRASKPVWNLPVLNVQFYNRINIWIISVSGQLFKKEQKKYSNSNSLCDTVYCKVLLYALAVFLKKWA